MNVVTVPTEQEFLFDLLMKAGEEGIILQTNDGRQFVLVSLEEWQGFDVGDSDDFEEEVRATSENKALMAFLAERKSDGERIPMKDVKKLLGFS
ncbi:hypothetical protein KFU94_69815 [Chloroflexi bacterium TSY]|nr:hypothetical protein [Chloroflexi bacterium TSY]